MAQDNSLQIFSSKFNEKRRIALSFDAWIGDSDEDCLVKGMLHVLAFLFPISIFRFVSNCIVAVWCMRCFLMDEVVLYTGAWHDIYTLILLKVLVSCYLPSISS